MHRCDIVIHVLSMLTSEFNISIYPMALSTRGHQMSLPHVRPLLWRIKNQRAIKDAIRASADGDPAKAIIVHTYRSLLVDEIF